MDVMEDCMGAGPGEELGYARISSHTSHSAHTSNEDESKSRGRKAVCVMGSRADEEGLMSRRASDGASEGSWIHGIWRYT